MLDDAVGAFIDQMKTELGVELDRELAARLGISPTAVAGWRARNTIPAKYKLRFARAKDEIADNATGHQTANRLREAYVFRLIDLISQRMYDDMKDGFPTEYTEMWRGYRLADAYSYFLDLMPQTDDKDALRKSFADLRAEVITDDFVNWIENLGT